MTPLPPPQTDITTTTGVVGEGQPRAWGRALAKPSAADFGSYMATVGGCLLGLAGYQWLVHDRGTFGTVMLAFAAGAVLGAIVAAIATAVKLAAVPFSFANQMPVGAPMTGKFGAQSIGVEIGEYCHHAQLGKKSRVAMKDQLMVVSEGDTKKSAAFVVPRELVPAELADHYLRQYGPDRASA